MARLPRYVLPGQPQHVIQRDNNRGVTFFAEEDYSFYRECLKKACDKHGCAVHAYVSMTNPVHLLLTPDNSASITKVMQSVGRRYVQYVNYSYRRTGTLWEGRYKATLIDSEQYLLTCSRYIELNPVRAGIVAYPGDYLSSSYRAHAYGQPDKLVQDHPLNTALGSTDFTRQEAYRDLFKVQIDTRGTIGGTIGDRPRILSCKGGLLTFLVTTYSASVPACPDAPATPCPVSRGTSFSVAITARSASTPKTITASTWTP